MRVRMKVAISGSRNGEDWPPVGREIDLPDDEAAHLIAQGLAEEPSDEDDETGAPETATPPDGAERRPARGGRKGVITKE